MQKRVIAGALMLCAAACFVSFAQEAPPSAIPKRDATHEVHKPHAAAAEDLASERAIRAQSVALIAEYNAKDADAYAERFLPDGEYEQDDGEVLLGRQAIRDYFAALFEQHPEAQAHLTDSHIRLISLHTAIQEGVASIAATPDVEPAVTRFVAIWSKVEGRWRLVSVRELSGGEGSGRTTHEHLEPLAWLVGDWMVENREAATVIKSHCEWSEDGNFLLQRFSVKVLGEELLSGTQRIGWDPQRERVRSWLFDSSGGFGEGDWNFDGEKWVIRTSAVRHDGEEAASVDFLIQISADSYAWDSLHRMLGNQNLPDLAAVVVRQPPPPAAEGEQPTQEISKAPTEATRAAEIPAEGIDDEPEEKGGGVEVRD